MTPYRILCNDVQREGAKPCPDVASRLFCYVPLHKIWYGICSMPQISSTRAEPIISTACLREYPAARSRSNVCCVSGGSLARIWSSTTSRISALRRGLVAVPSSYGWLVPLASLIGSRLLWSFFLLPFTFLASLSMYEIPAPSSLLVPYIGFNSIIVHQSLNPPSFSRVYLRAIVAYDKHCRATSRGL